MKEVKSKVSYLHFYHKVFFTKIHKAKVKVSSLCIFVFELLLLCGFLRQLKHPLQLINSQELAPPLTLHFCDEILASEDCNTNISRYFLLLFDSLSSN